ncbi:hypothetical protein [Ralstonia condita]|uniref:hypothetical protein n=1 Tax=Ralstonia condita TaxID=3058600 RepID=UPI00292D4BE0|nr:hypothetical protein [Ralstonia sp. LMG 7141]
MSVFERTRFPKIRDKRLGTSLTGKTLLRNPLHSVLLLQLVFGNWQAVEDAFSEPRVSPAQSPTRTRRAASTAGDTPRKRWLAKHQQRLFERFLEHYRDVRAKHPEESHADLLRRLPYTARIVLTQKRLAEVNENPEGRYERLDISLSRHIHTLSEKLRASGYEQRISRRALLTGHRMHGAWNRISDNLPLSRKALGDCEETSEAFAERRRGAVAPTSRAFSN